MLENMVEKLQNELTKVKHQSDLKDLTLQEVRFSLRDTDARIKEHEAKENFYKTQMEKLTKQVTTL